MTNNSSSITKVIGQTRRWLKKIILRHNFCPFGHEPDKKDLIRYAVCESNDPEAVAEMFMDELIKLRDGDHSKIETTLFITPNCFADFNDYNDFLDVVDVMLEELNLNGTIQIASFHPDYQFADLAADDARNYTNRSLHPTFHLILEDSIERARATHPDVESIPQTNMDLLEKQGLEESKKQLEACREE
ncbi:MAG: DUF1415 domain-containing protein [Candidatus Polarisedimenticolaceae bacterium]|nr:DUF1415 domain-containing protein [Candidatus Polarisedimenticolaceae bacterium]